MRKIRWILAPFAVSLIVFAVACSGGDGDDSKSSSDGSASGSGGSVSRELNLAQAATQLLELRSFRFNLSFSLDIDIEGLGDSGTPQDGDQFGAAFAAAFLALFSDISMEGAYVAPDSFDMQMSIAGEEVRYVQIGNEAWVNDGSGWIETEPDGGDLSFLGNPTTFATDILPDVVLQNAEISDDKVGGMAATRYHFDKASLGAVAAEMGEDTADFAEIDEMELDIWMIEGNVPVKFVVKVSGTDADGLNMGLEASFEITDINDDISVERPIP